VTVLDASALLAFLRLEPGAQVVRDNLRTGGALSTVNWAEALSFFEANGQSAEDIESDLRARGIIGQLIALEPFLPEDSLEAARLRPITRPLGLSLGDRACLALARRLRLPVLTADQIWEQLSLDLEIRLVR